MQGIKPQEVIDYLNSSLDALRDFLSSIEKDRDGLPTSLSFEGPGGWGPDIPIRLTQRSVSIGRDTVNFSAPNAGPRLIALLAMELASFVASRRPPLLPPRTQRD